MGGGERYRPALSQGDQGGRRQRGAFNRIGATADLVQQHEGSIVRLIQYLSQHANVSAEGREARGDRLLVSDVGVHAPEDRQRASLAHRRDNAGSGKRSGQTDRFEQDGLSAGVWTGDQQSALLQRELQVEGDHLDRSRQEKRMSPVHDSERSGRFGYRRLFASYRDGVSGAGDHVIHPNAHLDNLPEYGEMRSEQVGELPEHPERFPL